MGQVLNNFLLTKLSTSELVATRLPFYLPNVHYIIMVTSWIHESLLAILLGILVYQTQIFKNLELLLKNNVCNQFLHFSVSDFKNDRNIFHLDKSI